MSDLGSPSPAADAGSLRRQRLPAERTASWLTVIGRLRTGVGLERAAADLNAVEGDVARRRGGHARWCLR